MKERRKKAAALTYRRDRDSAPRLVARGTGHIAEKIIEIANTHGIHIREDRSLVEILSQLDLNQEIPPELYKAVAEILAFIYKLNKRASAS
ncbi:MAG: EscU/YscU/HrcU family type III secretion system export apparatus switch protein [Nitrospirae bacterium]|nr:EscU/YscU/HrcU family type III secretion system export apparatus switch protein [Nitrospirota bacterium]